GAMALGMTMTVVVVVALRDRADQLRHVLEMQALADPLTGLANRRSFEDAVARAAAWARDNDSEIALLTVDVDHFKKINDTWGHAIGDRALRAAVAGIDVLPGGPPGVSIGVAVWPDDGTTVETLQAASDAALYIAKTKG